MKKQLRDTRAIAGTPLERAFADFEAMEPAAGERRTRKPAKATIASADTRSQRRAATRARTAGANPIAEQPTKSSSSRSPAKKASHDPAVRKSRHEGPTEGQLRDVANPDIASGRVVSTDKIGVKKSSVGPSPNTQRTARRVAQPKASGRNRKARTTARKSDVNAARKPRRRQS